MEGFHALIQANRFIVKHTNSIQQVILNAYSILKRLKDISLILPVYYVNKAPEIFLISFWSMQKPYINHKCYCINFQKYYLICSLCLVSVPHFCLHILNKIIFFFNFYFLVYKVCGYFSRYQHRFAGL